MHLGTLDVVRKDRQSRLGMHVANGSANSAKSVALALDE